MAMQAFTVSWDQLTGPRDQTVLITGGSAGIGLQTAILLHELGNNVVVADRAAPHASAPSGSRRFVYQACDVTSWTSQRAAFEAGERHFGRIDAVFVNAGISEYRDQMFTDELDAVGLLKEPDRRTVDIDLLAANDTTKLAIHYLRKPKPGRPGGGGSIVMTASLAGYLASAGVPLYSAAKHGIVGLMRALKNDTVTLGIAVSVVAPGITLTDILSARQAGESLEAWATRFRGHGVPINEPQEIARCVVWLMGQGAAANGKGLLIQGGRAFDVESGLATSRRSWMGEEMLALFRAGRKAPLFPNKL